MQITPVDINSLIPYPKNAKKHPKEQIEKIKRSIQEFGFNQPIVVDKDNVVIVGHGRLEAGKELGLEEVPVLTVDLTEEQANAYRLADNKLNESEWDMDLVMEELKGMSDKFVDLTGFDINLEPEPEEIEDEVPDIPEEPKSQLGDVYQLGEHRLMCGDSTDPESVEKLLEGVEGKVHCISDPPYGIAYDPKNDKYGMIKNDDTFLDYIDIAKKHTTGFFIMWTGYQVVHEWVSRINRSFEKITNMIIWHKGGGGMGDCARSLAQDFEIILVVNNGNEIQYSRGGAVWRNDEDKKAWIVKAKANQMREVLEKELEGSVWKVSKDGTTTYLHPTQKPVEVNERLLLNFTKKGENILDLFLGSGSNLIACEKMGRACYGMELDPKYIDVIIERWEKFTGEKAVKI